MPRNSLARMLLASILGTAALTGCRSSSSTMFSRDEMNMGWSQFKKVDGVPITIKIPTHLKMYVYETHYLENDDLGNGVTKTRYIELPVTIRDFAHEMVYSQKIVMVDFKRPAAGAFNLDVDFTDDQYIKKVQHDVTDQTLAQVNAILGTLDAKSIFKKTSQQPPQAESSFKEIKSVVAVGMFEIDAPDFELQVNEFLACHINKSHDAWRATPGVTGVNRVFPTDIEGTNSIDSEPVLCPQGRCMPSGPGMYTPIETGNPF